METKNKIKKQQRLDTLLGIHKKVEIFITKVFSVQNSSLLTKEEKAIVIKRLRKDFMMELSLSTDINLTGKENIKSSALTATEVAISRYDPFFGMGISPFLGRPLASDGEDDDE